MKKFLAIALIAASFVACNEGEKTEETTTVTPETPAVVTPDTTVTVAPVDTTVTVAPVDTTVKP